VIDLVFALVLAERARPRKKFAAETVIARRRRDVVVTVTILWTLNSCYPADQRCADHAKVSVGSRSDARSWRLGLNAAQVLALALALVINYGTLTAIFNY